MARYPEFEHLYSLYQDFQTRCLLNDNSFFLPDQRIWTAENIERVIRRVVVNEDVSKDDFETKLRRQMQGASSEEWVIIAEAHLLYYLAPSNLRSTTRRDNVLRYLKESRISFTTLPTDEFWEKIGGFANTGQRFAQRYRQIWLILLFAHAVKESANRVALLSNHRAMEAMLDEQVKTRANADRAYDMRYAWLYLAFPDGYQPITSNEHRAKITDFYRPMFDIRETDNDVALYQIHQRLAQQRGVPPEAIHFYDADIRAEWGNLPAPALKPQLPIVEDEMEDSTPTQPDSEVSHALTKLSFTRNLIFTGAPGTGKTYTALRTARAWVEAGWKAVPPAYHPPPQELPITVLEEMRLYEVIALALYSHPREARFSNSQLLNLTIVQHYANIVMKSRNPSSTLGTALGMRVKPGNAYSNLAKTYKPYIFDKDVEGWFLSDEGRAFVEEDLADYVRLMSQPVTHSQKLEDFIQTVVFHPSYAYEDFVEGMRPVVDAEGNLSYEVRDGILRVMCNRAAADPDNRYVLIIDEINRANLSKVFGELISLIEDDKRLGMPNALTVKLPYSGDSFGVPSNLYFIGTLNTADRSIALMDVAMRRRFAFVEVPPRPALIGKLLTSDGTELDLGRVLSVLNQRIREHLGRSYEIGHSYFINIGQAASEHQMMMLSHVWNTQILPLLEEYFYSRPDTLREILSEFVLDDDMSEERLGFAEGEDLITALSRLKAT